MLQPPPPPPLPPRSRPHPFPLPHKSYTSRVALQHTGCSRAGQGGSRAGQGTGGYGMLKSSSHHSSKRLRINFRQVRMQKRALLPSTLLSSHHSPPLSLLFSCRLPPLENFGLICVRLCDVTECRLPSSAEHGTRCDLGATFHAVH